MNEAPRIQKSRWTLLKAFQRDILAAITEIKRKYGDIAYAKLRGRPTFFMTSPRFAEHLLFTNQDKYRKADTTIRWMQPIVGDNNLFSINEPEQWQRDRQIANGAFDRETYFEQYAQVVQQRGEQLLDDWGTRSQQGKVAVDVYQDVSSLLFNIVLESIFHLPDFDADFFLKNLPVIINSIRDRENRLNKLPWILPTQRKRTYDELMAAMGELVDGQIQARLASGKQIDDLLGRFIHAYQTGGQDLTQDSVLENQLRTFLVVSFVTTSSVLSWALIILSRNPELAERLFGEVRQVVGERAPNYQDVDRLDYTRAFVSEVLRLYPPVSMIPRQSRQADEIDGLEIPNDSVAMICTYHIHRDPDFWVDAEKFNPDRFLSQPWGQDNQYAFIPFGAGKRGCVGKQFALMELYLLVAMIVQRVRLSPIPGTTPKLAFALGALTKPEIEGICIEPR